MRDKEEPTIEAKYARLISDLRATVFEGRGETEQAVRLAAATGQALPEPWASYTAKVRDESWDVTDSDVESLKAGGHSEDAIFEMTIAAAVGAALSSLDIGLRTLHEGRSA